MLHFGFVSICLHEEKCSPAGSVTVARVSQLARAEARWSYIRRVAERNLENTRRIMWFLRAHGLPVYRISANLIPLATHPVTDGWEWWDEPSLREIAAQIGEAVHANGFRISSHLPEVCVLSTADEKTLRWLRLYLAYHERLFGMLGLDRRAKIIIHVGGGYGRPEQALDQAATNFHSLSAWGRERLVLENDDRVFSAAQTLRLCQRLKIPMVFDIHHHGCRNDGEATENLLPEVFATWTDRPPKVHVSTPKSDRQIRAHADYVDVDRVRPFLEYAASLGDVDVMVEAKMKDLAALRLREELGWSG